MKKIKIGKIELKNNLMLAPMAGITDLPLRILAKENGAGLVYSEMASAKALVYGDDKTKKLLKIDNAERPVAAQIFGGDTHSMSEAAKIVQGLGADIIDINLGCPVRKIAKAGAGAKLLADEKLISKILLAVVKSVEIPVTIKIRTGLVEGQNVAPEIIKIAAENGVKMVAVHARPASRGHSGEPDLQAFTEACLGAEIPVIANGGIIDEITADRFMKIPNCSGLMIGRGAIGNYSLFDRLNSFFDKGETLPKAGKAEKIEWFKKHAEMSAKYYGEPKGLIMMRKVCHYYVKDLPNASRIRDMFNKTQTLSEFNKILEFCS
ncbi:MAG: tRNA dihydrouridine synthase DusB [Endomicrobia bacterium]|nr:tRNA dihydrouridine synthase DusB [Endomicrobiia bacterium]MCL2506510.1 tRNA dihydrouridine synthase DusB [Endomicrobiia bacterium]